MKSYPVILIFLLSLFISSCTDTLTDIGRGTLSYSDSIIVKTATFHISSSTMFVKSITSQPDSFLLGTFNDTIFGTIKAEILAQLNCPKGYTYPAGTVADSAKIFLSYYSCFGDTLSPMDVNIYEMNLKTFSYTGSYASDINSAEYCDRSIKLSERIFKASKNSSTRKTIAFKLDNSFVNRFKNDAYYNQDSTFTKFFKGIYITANFGSATLLNIGREQLNLIYYYHYPGYKLKDIHGNDSTVYINRTLTFPASKEVRQVNCIQYPDRNTVVAPKDTVTYLASPANLYTEINLPLDLIKTTTASYTKGKKLTINSAMLHVNVTNTATDTILHPVAKYVLLIKDSGQSIDNFFKVNSLPVDTSSVLGRYTIAQIGTSSNYERYYSFDIAKLIANELKNSKNSATPATSIKLRLIPVAVGTVTNSSTGSVSISTVKQQYLMNAVTLRSGKEINPNSGDPVTAPMTLKLIYSGF